LMGVACAKPSTGKMRKLASAAALKEASRLLRLVITDSISY
jgi:hypothetical protein